MSSLKLHFELCFCFDVEILVLVPDRSSLAHIHSQVKCEQHIVQIGFSVDSSAIIVQSDYYPRDYYSNNYYLSDD